MGLDLSTAIARIDAIRKRPDLRHELVALLCERSAMYGGLTGRQAERLRGYVLASFAATGTPAAAMPFVIEELESGVEPYAVAGAARALLGSRDLPSGARDLLVRAADRIAASDEYVDHDRFETSASSGVQSAHAVLLQTIAGIDRRSTEKPAPCCSTRAAKIEETPFASRSAKECCGGSSDDSKGIGLPSLPGGQGLVPNVGLQDQSGASIDAHDFFIGNTTVVTFFYTRCMNPEKCSATITRLGNLQKTINRLRLKDRVSVSAITYDPNYDLPERLFRYGAERGVAFDERNKIFRTIDSFEAIQQFFQLGVSFGEVTVNRHRIELFVLDRSGRIAGSFLRTRWSDDDIVAAIKGVL